jgi:dihydroorotate dehydrogenase (NAD+) catalytic subunit
VWDTGLQNPGIEYFLAEELPALAATGAPVIVSIAGTSLEEYVRLTSALHARQEVSAIEVHLSGPDLELRRPVLGARVDRASEIVGACARLSRVPVFPKVPFGGNLEAIAVACVRAGARGLTLVGPLPAGSAGGSSGLESAVGWLAGPAIKPLVLGAVRRMSQALPEVPIMASGGVRTTRDAVEMLAAGAWAVQVGTATLIDPQSPVEIARGILRYIRHQGLGSPADLRGAAVETASPRASE